MAGSRLVKRSPSPIASATAFSGAYPAFGYADLGSMPITAASTGGLDTSLAAVAGSWWRLDPADWPTAPASKTLQYRMLVVAQGMTAADVLGALLYDADAGAGMFAEVTKAADGDSSTSVASAWQTFPATGKSGYLMTRNQTAARGLTAMACIQVRIA